MNIEEVFQKYYNMKPYLQIDEEDWQHIMKTYEKDEVVDELAKCSADVETRLSAIPEEDIKSAPRGSAYVILTHDHALDFILCGAALDRHDAKYVGMIGSKTKKVKFKKWYQVNYDNKLIRDFICPIGNVKNQDKRPSIIASSVTAEVINMLFANVNLSEQYDLNLNKVAI